jgi:hypothetical protein
VTPREQEEAEFAQSMAGIALPLNPADERRLGYLKGQEAARLRAENNLGRVEVNLRSSQDDMNALEMENRHLRAQLDDAEDQALYDPLPAVTPEPVVLYRNRYIPTASPSTLLAPLPWVFLGAALGGAVGYWLGRRSR